MDDVNEQKIKFMYENAQPWLLDRLTDEEPSNKKYLHEKISPNKLKKYVLRDLQWLLNCSSNEFTHELNEFPHIQVSCFNYGILPLSGKKLSDLEWNHIQFNIKNAITIFEPRIMKKELEVNCISNWDSLELYNIISLEIKGLIWNKDFPVEFTFHTDINLENGSFKLKNTG